MTALHLANLEADLWEAADQLRANSKLSATEYSMPVLGLIFLRHATTRFDAVRREIEKSLPKRGGVTRPITKDDFRGRAAIYLPERARYDRLAELPSSEDLGAAIDEAMKLVEQESPEQLQGMLPRGYGAFEKDLLRALVRIFDREALRTASGDVFGRIYEYFLNQFALSGAQEEGAFFTPPSLVRLIVNVIEPNHGTVLDPACGSAGMLVWSAHFIEQLERDPGSVARFVGREKSDTTVKLARMNVAVHGFDADIAQGNSYYDRYDDYVGRCDFVMANPPFNVDGVDPSKIKEDPRLWTAKKIPGITKEAKGKKGKAKPAGVSNANYLWIQYFRAYLNPSGRAGFVMAASATDAGHGEQEIRRELVQTGDVDAIVRIGEKFFYTRSLPCTLWFLDRGKPAERRDRVLMLDARGIHRVVNRRVHDFSEEQLANLTAVVWLFRGQGERFTALVRSYLTRTADAIAALPAALGSLDAPLATLDEALAVADGCTRRVIEPGPGFDGEAWAERCEEFRRLHDERRAALAILAEERASIAAALDEWRASVAAREDAVGTTKRQHAAWARLEPLLPRLRALQKHVGEAHKLTMRALDHAEKALGVRDEDDWDARAVKGARAALDAARHEAVEGCRLVAYFAGQAHWLLSRFPYATFVAVPGLCAAPTLADIERNDWSLTPGRYVGAAPPVVDEDEDVEERLRVIHEELAALNDEALELARQIAEHFEAVS